MSTRFGITGTSSGGNVTPITDHNQLLNIGTHTHAQIDLIIDEIEKARGNFTNLDARLDSIENSSGGGGGATYESPSNYVYESFIIDTKTSVITLTTGTYKVGSGELEVFVGGIKQKITEDYIETSSTSITFTEDLPAEAIVILRVRDRLGSFLPTNITVENIIVTSQMVDSNKKQFALVNNFSGYGISLEVYVNGLLQALNQDYSISGNSVNFSDSLLIGSLITFKIIDKNIGILPKLLYESFNSSGLQTTFVLQTFTYEPNKNQLEVYVNGILYVNGIDYTEIDNKTFQFTEPPPSGCEVRVCRENGVNIQSGGGSSNSSVEYQIPQSMFNGYSFTKEIQVGEETDVVTLSQPYTLGQDELVVFWNGQAIQHTELSSTTIKLPVVLEAGDQVFVKKFPKVLLKLDKLVSNKQFNNVIEGNSTKVFSVNIQTSAIEIKYIRIQSNSIINAEFNIVESPTDSFGVISLNSDLDSTIIYNDKMPYVDEVGQNKLYLKVENKNETNLTFDLHLKYLLYST